MQGEGETDHPLAQWLIGTDLIGQQGGGVNLCDDRKHEVVRLKHNGLVVDQPTRPMHGMRVAPEQYRTFPEQGMHRFASLALLWHWPGCCDAPQTEHRNDKACCSGRATTKSPQRKMLGQRCMNQLSLVDMPPLEVTPRSVTERMLAV